MTRALVGIWALFVAGGLFSGWTGLSLLHEVAVRGRPISKETLPLIRETSSTPTALVVATVMPQDGVASDDLPPFAAASADDNVVPTPQPSSPVGRMNILLLGIDQRPDQTQPGDDPGRTDSMVLVSIDFDAHTASMVSIPRDGFVVIPATAAT